MKKTFLLLALLATTVVVKAQILSVTGVSQSGDNIVVTYSLTGGTSGQTFDVDLYVSEDGKKTWTRATKTTGDVGAVSTGTSKKITWNVLAEPNRTQLISDEVYFKVKATVTTPEVVNTVTNLPEMVKITGGTFTMGSDIESDEKPTHSVTLSTYYMGKYEVTNAEFAEFLNDYGQTTTKSSSDYPNQSMAKASTGSYNWGLQQSGTKWSAVSGYDNYPVIYVTWYGAYEYCEWLSEKTGEKYSLPTEAQWEYAAGGGSSHQKWAGTNTESSLGTYAWFSTNSSSKTHEVGTKTKNSFGLYDMSGNVWEWCLDWYSSTYYTSAAVTNPVNTSVSSYRVLRGGGWYGGATYCRVAGRDYGSPSYSSIGIGFRVVKTP